MTDGRKLYRSRDDRVIVGVCGGLGEYLGIDPVFIRLIALVLLFAGGSAFVVYVVMAIVVPERPLGEVAPRTPSDPAPAPAPVSAPAPAPASVPAPAAAPAPSGPVAVGQRSSRRAGLMGGLVLIGIGVVFLLAQFMPGIAWWNMWPLIIILVGAVRCVTPGRNGWDAERFFGGLATIVTGLVLLGNVTGYVSWRVWWVLLSLWPVLLVSIGLSLLAKGLGQTWLRAVGSLVILAAFVYAAALSWTGSGVSTMSGAWVVNAGGEPYGFTEAPGGVTSAKLTLEGGGANIRIGSGSSLVDLTGESQFGRPTLSAKRVGDRADVRIATTSQGTVLVGPGVVGQRMDLMLGTTPVWDVDLSTGASALEADFSNVRLSSLTLSTGVSSSDIRLGAGVASGERVPIVVKSGIGSVSLSIPETVEARVDVAGGLSGTDVGGRLEKVGDHWETPGYSSSDTGYEIRIESGIGSVAVDTH